MTVALFRQEAIDHQRLRIWGEVTLALPISYALVTGFIAAFRSRRGAVHRYPELRAQGTCDRVPRSERRHRPECAATPRHRH